MRLAWFSPMPPHRSGIAAYSADVLPSLASAGLVDVYVDDGPGGEAVRAVTPVPGAVVRGAYDFMWRHAQAPYDCIVYQLGNDSCHDYMWPYLLQYPGLVVLHDAQLHQARARALLRRGREEDYVKEFAYSHPHTAEAVARMVAAGLVGTLYYLWPMLRVPVEAARLVAVHNRWLAAHLADQFPGSPVIRIRMGVPDPLASQTVAPPDLRRRHGIPEDAVVCAAFGRVTPEKGLTRVLMALAQLDDAASRLHVLCVGDTVDYYDIREEARQLGLGERVHVTGYVPDEDLPSYLAAADLCLCLRWPTARETSASLLRCMAAGKATVINDLVHTMDTPTIDLRSMTVRSATAGADPIAVGIDMLDDINMLRLALRRMVEDVSLRQRIGDAARRYWRTQATVDVMARDYLEAVTRTPSVPTPERPAAWPAHLVEDSLRHVHTLLTAAGLTEAAVSRMADIFPQALRPAPAKP